MRTPSLITSCMTIIQISNHRLLIDKTKPILRHSVLLSCWLVLIIPTILLAPAQSNAFPRLHLYVHYDYIVNSDGTSDAPDPEAIDLVRQAFDAHGIDLVIDSHHTGIPFWSMITFDSSPGNCATPATTTSFDTLKAQYFHSPSAHEWHYAIFGERHDCLHTSGASWV